MLVYKADGLVESWSETIAGRCRAWTEEQMETAGVLALIYGKVRRHEAGTAWRG